ncbi:MAG: DoxX family protein [Nanoarchaeota archaeon]
MQHFMNEHGGYFYFIFRVIVGLLFLLHGAQKFGVFGGDVVAFGTLFWFAGAIELIVGTLVVVGLLTRWAALVGAVEMLVAYFMKHASQGWNPLTNQGEPALLFLATFLVLMIYGYERWGLDSYF